MGSIPENRPIEKKEITFYVNGKIQKGFYLFFLKKEIKLSLGF